MMPRPAGVRTVRAYRSAVTSSTPGIARARRKASRLAASNGSRQASRSVSHVPYPPWPARASWPWAGAARIPGWAQPVWAGAARERVPPAWARSCDGVRPADSSTVALNWRTLAKPLANATSVIGMLVSASSRRAVCSRAVRASASGPVPSSAASSRCRCRGVTASRLASPPTPCSST